MSRKRLGEILLQAGVLELKDLRAALHEQLRWGGPLGRVLVDMKLVSEDTLVQALSRQLGVKPVALQHVSVADSVIALIPAELAARHEVVPFRIDGDVLEIAMGDPTRSGLVAELELHSHMKVRPCIAGPKALETAVARYYGRGAGMLDLTLGKAGVVSSQSKEEKDWLEETSGIIVTDDRDRRSQTEPLPDEPSVRAALGVEPQEPSVVAPEPARAPAPRPRARATSPISQAGPRRPSPLGANATGQSAPDRTPSLSHARTEAVSRVDPRDKPPLSVGNGSGETEVVATLRREVAALQSRVSTLEALLGRDEDVLRKLMALLIDKRVATREEILTRIK